MKKSVADFLMAAGVACLLFRVLVAESYFADGANRVGRIVLGLRHPVVCRRRDHVSIGNGEAATGQKILRRKAGRSDC